MVTRTEAFPTRFLQSVDVKKAPGGRLVDIIQHVEMEEMAARDGKPARDKPVISLQNTKPFVCNITNYNSIADVLGEETDHWPGAKLALVVKRVTMGRDLVDGIRVDKIGRPGGGNVQPVPKQEQPQTPPPQTHNRRDDLDDEIPF